MVGAASREPASVSTHVLYKALLTLLNSHPFRRHLLACLPNEAQFSPLRCVCVGEGVQGVEAIVFIVSIPAHYFRFYRPEENVTENELQ